MAKRGWQLRRSDIAIKGTNCTHGVGVGPAFDVKRCSFVSEDGADRENVFQIYRLDRSHLEGFAVSAILHPAISVPSAPTGSKPHTTKLEEVCAHFLVYL